MGKLIDQTTSGTTSHTGHGLIHTCVINSTHIHDEYDKLVELKQEIKSKQVATEEQKAESFEIYGEIISGLKRIFNNFYADLIDMGIEEKVISEDLDKHLQNLGLYESEHFKVGNIDERILKLQKYVAIKSNDYKPDTSHFLLLKTDKGINFTKFPLSETIKSDLISYFFYINYYVRHAEKRWDNGGDTKEALLQGLYMVYRVVIILGIEIEHLYD